MTETKFFPYILGSEFVNLVVDGKSHTIQKTNPVFPIILECIKNRDAQGIRDNISITDYVNSRGGGLVTVKDDQVYYGDETVHNEISRRILQMMSEGFNVEFMIKFLQNLMLNPSQSAIQELYLFLEANTLPITEDGYFLAYKVVRSDFTDKHTGTFDNSVGAKPKMDRSLCDTNRDNVCSSGLHFCGLSYLSTFGRAGDKVVIVKINPKDVTSIPSDYNNAKGRACEYEVYEFYGDFESVFQTQRWNKSVEIGQSEDDSAESDSVLDAVISIISDQIYISACDIDEDSNLIDDLNCDDLDMVEIERALEEKYDIDLSDMGDNVIEVQDIVKLVEIEINNKKHQEVTTGITTNPIKAARIIAGYSQKAVAEYAGYSKSTLWNAEQESNHPKMETINRWIDTINKMLEQDNKGFEILFDETTGMVRVK